MGTRVAEARGNTREPAMHVIRPASILIAALALFPGCALGVGQLRPTPNVLLVPSSLRLSLRIAPEVGESFATDTSTASSTTIGGPQSVTVSQWHETLTNGFRDGIGRAFAPASNQSDLTLVLLQASLTVIVLKGALSAQIRFRAELLDAKQRIVKTWADTASSRTTGFLDDAEPPVRSAVEAMYEEIANGLPPSAPVSSS
jgi:hypothetical protein